MCGFNLIGLSPTGLCPECGQPVERSLQGDLLRFSAPEYVALLHRGVVMVQAAIIARVLLYLGGFAGSAFIGYRRAGVDVLVDGGAFIATLVSVVGWWLLSAPDPAAASADTGARARRVVRVAIAATAAAEVLRVLADSARGSAAVSASGAAVSAMVWGLAWVVGYFAALKYLRWLAPRLPDERVRGRTSILMWLVPVLLFLGSFVGSITGGPLAGAVAAGLSFLIGLILYYNLLEWVRRDLRAIRAQSGAMAG